MSIRRAGIFVALLAVGALGAFGQAVEWSGAGSPSQQFPNFPISCTLPAAGNLSGTPSCLALGQNFSETMIVTPGQGVPFTWAVSSGKMPPGLGITTNSDFSATIAGMPTVAGVYSFQVTATHSASTFYTSTVYTIAVGTGTVPSLPTITQTPLPSTANSGIAVPSNWYTAVATGGYPCVTSAAINAVNCPVNGTAPYYNWSFSSGTNADGLSISPTTGAITGTPLSGGAQTLVIQATDGLGQNAVSWTANVTIGGAANFTIVTGTLPAGAVGTAYTPTVTSQGGLTPMTWTRVSGNLPPGVNDCTPSNISCTFSGTPTVAGTYNFSLKASYNNGSAVDSNIQAYTVVIAQSGSTLALPVPTPQSVALNQAVTMNFVASGGTTPYAFATTPLFGSFPPGLTLSTAGVLSGNATTAGTYNFTVQVTDNAGAKASAASSIAVGNTLSLATPASQTVTVGQTVTMQFTASGGTGSNAYTVITGGLPPNLSLNGTTGQITGTIAASASGAYNFTVQVKDASNNIATAQGSITVSGISMSSPPAATIAAGLSATQQFTATGGTPPYAYSITGATFNGGSITVPAGLTIDALSGLLTFATTVGTAPGAYVPTVQATDSASHTTTALGSVTVTASSLGINSPAAVTLIVGQNVSMQFTAAGGTAPYTYSIASGALPPGVSLAGSTGLVSGTTTTAGTYTFAIKATDAASGTATSNTATITANAALTLPSPATVTGVNGQTLTMQFTAAGGTAPYTYSVTGVTLNGTTISTPAAMTINSASGLLTFVTTSASAQGPYVITVQAKDSASTQATTTGTGTITLGASLTMATPPAILNGVVGQAITMQFTATGGTPPYTYAFVGGNLPQGLTLNTTTGLVSGTPTASGNYGFTIQATDSATPPLTAAASGNIVLTNLSLTGSNVSVTITNSSGTNLNGTAIPADTQPTVTVTIGSPLSQNIQGTIGVSFKRTFDGAASSEVSFPAGQQVNFQIPAGTTTAVFGTSNSTQLKVGTAAGSGQIQAIFQDSLGNNITPQNLQTVQFSVAPTAPVVNCPSPCGFTISGPTANSGSTPGGQYTVTIIGYSTTLNMTGVSFTFTPTSGTNLASTTVTVPLTNSSGQNVFANWFGNSQSNQYGGQFTLQVPLNFTVSGGSQSNPIAGATVTLTNSQGSFTSGVVIPQ